PAKGGPIHRCLIAVAPRKAYTLQAKHWRARSDRRGGRFASCAVRAEGGRARHHETACALLEAYSERQRQFSCDPRAETSGNPDYPYYANEKGPSSERGGQGANASSALLGDGRAFRERARRSQPADRRLAHVEGSREVGLHSALRKPLDDFLTLM